MLTHDRCRQFILGGIALAVCSPWLLGDDESPNTWLRGSGNDLEMRLWGGVVQSGGLPATDVDITIALKDSIAIWPLESTVDGDQFEIWLPVNRLKWSLLCIKAASTTSDEVAYQTLNPYEWRQAAIDGIKLTLQPATRTVSVKVIDHGEPVAGAFVCADGDFGIPIQSKTGAEGVALIELLPQQELRSLTAWTDDYRIGGYSLNRTPIRDPFANSQIVELNRCRDQLLRFVDEYGDPVGGVEFGITIAVPPPKFNPIGTHEHSQMVSNASGEALYKWFPDWEEYYVVPTLKSDEWILDGDHEFGADTVVFKLKRSKFPSRMPVTGKVRPTDSNVGGLNVVFRSFQGERERFSDSFPVFTDASGSFTARVLPDATYCVYIADTRLVSNIIDVLAYDSRSKVTASPELTVSNGQPVEVLVTSGPNKLPYANLPISLKREHAYSWNENGETRYGTSGPQWWVTTDESGKATTYTLPGALSASVITPRWQASETIEVLEGDVARIALHRAVEEERVVTGRLLLPEGLSSSLDEAQIRVCSVDGKYPDVQVLKTDRDGGFSLTTLSTKVGVYAVTKDGQAAGTIVVSDLESPIELPLLATMEFRGRLLGDGDQPLAGHPVLASSTVEAERDDNSWAFARSFVAARFETRTDEQGNYTLRGLPSKTKISIWAAALDGSEASFYVDQVYLEPNELRPVVVSRLGTMTSGNSNRTLADRFPLLLRDGSLTGFRVILIVRDESDLAVEFVRKNLLESADNPDVASFLQLEVATDGDSRHADTSEFLDSRGLQGTREGRVYVCAVGSNGDELGRLEIGVADPSSPNLVKGFLREHAPVQLDAVHLWNDAFAEAQRTNRHVWVRVSQRYCGPCFQMARWLDDQREILDKEFVLLKIDDVRDKNGAEVAKRLTGGKHHGVPFHAIFDSKGELLIDSVGPIGNVGHPDGFEGQRQVRKMLLESRQRLTDAEIDQLVDSLAK